MRDCRLINLVWLFVLGCSADPAISPSETLNIEVSKPGWVTVGEETIIARPGQVNQIIGLPSGPYTVIFEGGSEPLVLVGIQGPVADFRPVQGDSPSLFGDLQRVLVVPDPPGARDAVVLAGGHRYHPIEATNAGWYFEIPRDTPLEVLAIWGEPAHQIGYRTLQLGAGTEVRIEASEQISGRLAVGVDGRYAGWIEAELTIDNVRTGLILDHGLAPINGAVALARPQRPFAKAGIWLTADARTIERPSVANVSAHIAVTRESVQLSWRDGLELDPPLLKGSRALPFEQLSWTGAQATYLDIQIQASTGCSFTSWRFIVPADAEWVPPAWPTLKVARLQVGLTAVDLGGVNYNAYFGGKGVAAHRLPELTNRVHRFQQAGDWRGDPLACRGHPDRGEYILQSEVGCDLGRSAPIVVIDYCGALLAPQTSVGPLCGPIDEYSPRHEGDSLSFETAGRRLYLSRVVSHRVPAVAALTGGWFRVEVTEQHREIIEGIPGPGLEDPVTLSRGAAHQGPWLEIYRSGRLSFRSKSWGWNAELQTFDGQRGYALVLNPGCKDEVRRIEIKLDADELILTEIIPLGDGTGRVRTASLQR